MNNINLPAEVAENEEIAGFNNLDVPTIPHYQPTASTEGEDIDTGAMAIYARMFSSNADAAGGRSTNNIIANSFNPPLSLPTQSQYLELEPVIKINPVLPQNSHSTLEPCSMVKLTSLPTTPTELCTVTSISQSSCHQQYGSSFSNVINSDQSPAVSVPKAKILCPEKTIKGLEFNNVADEDEDMSLHNRSRSTWFPDFSNLAETDIKNIEQIIRTSVIAGITAITSMQTSKKRDEKHVETETRTNTETEMDTPMVNLTVHIGNNYYKDFDGAPCTTNRTKTKIYQQQQQTLQAATQHFTLEGSTPEPTFLPTSALNNLEETTEHCADEVTKNGLNSDSDKVGEHHEKKSITNYSPSDNIERGLVDPCSHISKTSQHFDSDNVPFNIIMSQFVHDEEGCYKCIQTGCSTILRHRQSVRRHWIKHYKKNQEQHKQSNNFSKSSHSDVATVASASSSSSTCSFGTANNATTTTATASYVSSVGSASSSSSSSARSSNGSVTYLKRNKVRYVCIICDAALSRRDTYQRHMRSHKQAGTHQHQESISDVEDDIIVDSNCELSDSDDDYVGKEDFGFGKRFGPPSLSRKRLILDDKLT